MQNANGKKNEATFLVTHRMEKSIFKDYKLMRKWSDLLKKKSNLDMKELQVTKKHEKCST